MKFYFKSGYYIFSTLQIVEVAVVAVVEDQVVLAVAEAAVAVEVVADAAAVVAAAEVL